MNSISANHINELKASEAFTNQSKIFDALYGRDAIIQYKRRRVREHVLKYAKPGTHMLELNCGTGEDAIFFAQKGFQIHATDISEGMLKTLKGKIEGTDYENKIEIEQLSFTELNNLQSWHAFDCIFSNFGGLNCTAELGKVLQSFDALLKPGGVITLVIISKFCLWETLLVFKGKLKTAFRRFFARKGRKAQIEGSFFKCWYYSPSFIQKHLPRNFTRIGLEGLCTIVPPSYIENFTEKHPKLFQQLTKKEDRLKSTWPWNRMGDYFIVSFQKQD